MHDNEGNHGTCWNSSSIKMSLKHTATGSKLFNGIILYRTCDYIVHKNLKNSNGNAEDLNIQTKKKSSQQDIFSIVKAKNVSAILFVDKNVKCCLTPTYRLLITFPPFNSYHC